MANARVYEGTLKEITERHGNELSGRRLRVVVDDTTEQQAERPFYETASPEEWAKAWNEWVNSHKPTGHVLTDEAISRDSIYEGRG